MSSFTKVDSFGLLLPDEWVAIPTELGAFDDFCNRARARWKESPSWDRALERRAETMLTRLRRELSRSGIVLAAVMASCTIGVYTKDDLDTKLSLTPQMLFSAFARRPAVCCSSPRRTSRARGSSAGCSERSPRRSGCSSRTSRPSSG